MEGVGGGAMSHQSKLDLSGESFCFKLFSSCSLDLSVRDFTILGTTEEAPLSCPPFFICFYVLRFGFQIFKSCSGTCWGGFERESSGTVKLWPGEYLGGVFPWFWHLKSPDPCDT